MKTWIWMSALIGLNVSMLVGCSEEAPPPAAEPAPVEEPKKPEIPAYAPTGDLADVKLAAAAGITAENASERAKALEAKLDAALQGDAEPAEAAAE